MTDHLRPIERRVLALRSEGIPVDEIARRFRRSPEHIERILAWTRIPREGLPGDDEPLRPLERRILDLRADGMPREEIADRFRRSPAHIRRVEGLAHYRKALDLLS